jgi:predicted DCC family thiol-disulfide oxidoreductase YuxK
MRRIGKMLLGAALGWGLARTWRGASAARATALYDGRCPLCLATVARLRRWDTGRRLEYLDARDAEAVEARFPWLAHDPALNEMRLVFSDGRVLGGFDAVRALAAALPRLRPLAAVLFLPGIRPFGLAAYRFIAAHRPQTFHCTSDHCDLGPAR